MEQMGTSEGGPALWTVLPIAAAIVLALVSVIWKFVNDRISKQDEGLKQVQADQADTRSDVHEHDVQLARGDQKFDFVKEQLKDIQTTMRRIEKNCPKCPG